MCATDVRQTDVRRVSALNAPALGQGYNKLTKLTYYSGFRFQRFLLENHIDVLVLPESSSLLLKQFSLSRNNVVGLRVPQFHTFLELKKFGKSHLDLSFVGPSSG